MNILQFESYLGIDTAQFHEVNIETLNHYLERYMLTVPFENIDVQNGVPISLNIDDLYDKIVRRKRGGYCYEMNTLFQYYLREKGFDAHLVSATIHTPNGGRSQPGSHMSILVYLEQIYVADVGFGDLPLQAMPLAGEEAAETVKDINGDYRAIYGESGQFFIQKWQNDHWEIAYEATVTSRNLDDFSEAIDYNQHNENSVFVRKIMITLAKTYGRVTMSEDNVTITKDGEKKKMPVTANNYRKLLSDYFGLHVKINRLEK